MDRRTARKLLIAGGVLLTVCVLVIVVLVFLKQQRVVGGLRGGPIGPNESAYREDYKCLGIPYDFCPNWPDYGCDYLCYGFVYAKECSIETFKGGDTPGFVREPTACR